MTIKVASGLRATYENAVEMSVEETLSTLERRTNCYEVLGDVNRVFLDVDGKRLPAEMTREEWQTVYEETRKALHYLADGRPYSIKNGSNYASRIISIHIIFPKMKTTRADNKVFAQRVRESLVLPEGISVDVVPYGSNQKVRMVGSSKDGEDRPFVLEVGTPEDTLISYVGDAEYVEFQAKTEEKVVGVAKIVEQQRLVSICRLIKDERWVEYSTCLSLIFALMSCGATPEFIHEQCMRGSNYEHRWVANAIRDWKGEGSPTFGTLLYYAKLDNPTEVDSLLRHESEVAVEEIMMLTTTGCPADDLNWCTEGGWLKDLPDHPTLAVSSMLGTGKTRQMIAAAAAAKRVLFISVRRTFSDHILSDIQGFTDYRKVEDRKEGKVRADKALVSIQSLHRRDGGEEDLVILDEIESILENLSPNTTHGSHYQANVAAFERIVRGAKRVIALDAFLSDRTVDCLRLLRPSVRILVNPFVRYQREAVVYENFGAYVTECEKRIRSGKKVYMFWGAKKKGESFHDLLTCPNQIYTADTDKQLVAEHLSNVNVNWAPLQVVGGTSSLSVGVNYTGTPSFDQTCAYVTPFAGGSGRNTMQSIHRVRVLNDNKMVFFIQKVPNNAIQGELGLAAQKREYSRTTERQTTFLREIGETPTDYARLPVWVRDVIAWNRNERLVNARHLRAVCFAYLKRCGVSVTLNGSTDLRELEPARCPHHSEIDDIDYEQATLYQLNRSVLTATQKLELEKYYLLQKMTDCSHWEEWLRNPKQITNAWRIRNETPVEIVHNGPHCLDLVSRNAEKLNVVLSLGIDFKQNFRKPISELPDLNLDCWGVRVRSAKDTKEQTYRDLCKGLEGWALLRCTVVRERKMVKGVSTPTYYLEYCPESNPVQRSLRTNLTCAEIFAEYKD